MSQRLFTEDTLFLQRLLSCAGFYADTLDGDWGPNTDAAEKAFLAASDAIATAHDSFDARSEKNIRTLLPQAQEAARKSLVQLHAAGTDARVLSGTRSYGEQNTLFRQGRFGNPGAKVTNAKGGQSWHNFGRAWDIGIFIGGQYQTGSAPYKTASEVALLPGVEWGGNWTSFPDMPHYQWKTAGQKITAARAFFESGGRSG
jgi:peptidoglycan LD-endopeptidase CwlK